MPLTKGRSCKTKHCKNMAVHTNIAVLTKSNKSKRGKKKLTHDQIVAAAMRYVFGARRK